MTAPNVVLFLIDDMRRDDMAWMPNVQRQLVDEGVSFTASYASYSLCCPSRASLLTGQYPHRTGVISNTPPHNIHAFDDTNTLGTWLTAAGYTTGFVGKYLNGYGDPPFGAGYVPPGWTVWRVPYARTYNYLDQQISVDGSPVDKAGEYSTTLYGDYAASFLTHRLPPVTPVYLQVNFVAPHSGSPRDPDDPPNSGELSTPYVDPPFRGEYRGPTLPDSAAYDEPDITDKPALGDLPRITRSVATRIKRATQQRRDSLLAADIQIKRIIDLVTALGQADNTLFVFLSDNGYFSGEHRITRGKNSHYEPAAHVPLVVRGPGFAPGTVSDQLTGVHDVAPTVLAAAGASPGAGHVFDGRPLQAAPTPDGRAILLEIGDGEGGFVARGVVSPDRWKYVEIRGGFVEMYDLTADPYERHNRAAEPRHADKRAELAELLRQLTAGEERAGSR